MLDKSIFRKESSKPEFYDIGGLCFKVWEYSDRVEFIFACYSDLTARVEIPSILDVNITHVASCYISSDVRQNRLLNMSSGEHPVLNDMQIGRTQYLLGCASNIKDLRLSNDRRLALYKGEITFSPSVGQSKLSTAPGATTWVSILSHFTQDLSEHTKYMGPWVNVEDFKVKIDAVNITWISIDSNFNAHNNLMSCKFLGQHARSGSLLLVNDDTHLCGFSPFITESNPNMFIASNTAGGGAFLTYSLVTQHIHNKGYALIMDIGRSYQHIAERLGGHHVILPDKEFSINPFPLLFKYKESCSYEADVYSIFEMLATQHGPLDGVQCGVLFEAVKAEIACGYEVTVYGVFSRIDMKYQQLHHALSPYAYGHYSWLFKEKSCVDFDSDLTVIEFEGLIHSPDLKQIVVAILTSQSFIYLSNLEARRPKMILATELFDLWKGGKKEYYESIFRRSRKRNVSFVGYTMSVKDKSDNEVISCLWDNAGWKMIGRQRTEDIEYVKALFDNDRFSDLLPECGVRNGSTSFILSQNGSFGKFRYVVDPYSYGLFCTEPRFCRDNEKTIKKPLTQSDLIYLSRYIEDSSVNYF
jgi:hypothetical protein